MFLRTFKENGREGKSVLGFCAPEACRITRREAGILRRELGRTSQAREDICSVLLVSSVSSVWGLKDIMHGLGARARMRL